MSRAPQSVPFAEWAPDKSDLSGASRVGKGCISQSGHYAPLQDLAAYKDGAAISGAVLGARGFWGTNGSVNIFSGNATDLIKLVSRQPTVVSKSGGYTASVPDGWQFEQFGNTIIAVNSGVTTPQKYVIGTSSLFEDLGGTPPTAKTVFRVGRQLVLANDITCYVSGFNNIELWDYAVATQGVQFDVDARLGNIQTGVRGAGGQVGLIFHERGITRLTYVGPPTVFDAEPYESAHGAISREAVSIYGNRAYFASPTGLYVTDGLQTVSVGEGKVDKYFADNLNYSARGSVCTAIDFARKLWLVAFPSGGSKVADRILIYSIEDGRWTYDDIAVQMLFEMPREGVTVDDLAGIIALEGTSEVNEISTSVDDPQWRETRVQAAAVDEFGVVSTFEGANRAATLETTEFEPVKLKQTLVDEIWPEIDIVSTRINGYVRTRDRQIKRFTWDDGTDTERMLWGGLEIFWGSNAEAQASADMNEYGFCPVLVSTRYMSVGLEIAAGTTWTEATGINWRGSPGGEF